VRCSLQIAVAKGFVPADAPAHAIADRLGALLYRLARP
jgi:hypothetical protein